MLCWFLLAMTSFYFLLQLSSTLVRLCMSDLETFCTNTQHQFWSVISEAIHFKAQCPPSKPTKGASVGSNFISKLESYLQLRTTFKDFLAQVRDVFLTQQHVNFSHLSSSKKTSLGSTAATAPGTKKSVNSSKTESGVSLSSHPLGMPLHNTEKIMSGIDRFTLQVSNMLELVSTLGQFTRINLEQRIKGLPRFAGLWKLEGLEAQGQEEDSLGQSFNQSDGMSLRTGTVPGDGSVSDITLATPDYLDMLISRNLVLQQQQQQQVAVAAAAGCVCGGSGRETRRSVLHSGGLSTLKEESWIASVQSEEETEQKPQGL